MPANDTNRPSWWQKVPLQFSMRTLLLAFCAISVLIGMVAREYHQGLSEYHQEELVAKAVEEHGGNVNRSPMRKSWLSNVVPTDWWVMPGIYQLKNRITSVQFKTLCPYEGTNPVLDDPLQEFQLFEQICQLKYLSDVNLYGTDISDGVIAALLKNSRIKSLNLNRPITCPVKDRQISDADFEAIVNSTSLEKIGLIKCNLTNELVARLARNTSITDLNVYENSQLTNDCCVELAKMRQLKVVELGNQLGNIGSQGITDDGVRELVALNHLEELTLNGAGITKNSIPYLVQMKRLQSVDVRDTIISKTDIEPYRESHPDIWVLIGYSR